MNQELEDRFEVFFDQAEPRLRAALVAKFGPDQGRDAAAEALAYGWQNWARVEPMANPAGYLYRVGDRWARWQVSRRLPLKRLDLLPAEPPGVHRFEPGLADAMAQLSPRQRQTVVLTAGFGLTHRETAALLGCSRSSVQNHVERGLAKLRTELGVTT